jgi:methylmalonyl-CoA mutase N-terminal domain/subunit
MAVGLDPDAFMPRMSFFFASHNNLFEEAAKFRAARRMWAKIARDRFGATDPKSQTLRFHTQTGGVTLTAQQPLNNVVRVAYQALAAVLGGTQSLHTNGYDEALALPTEEAATIALRTQQILAFETGVADTADPLAGSYFVESLTDELEAAATAWMDRIAEQGGAVAAIEAGAMQAAIADNAYRLELARERGDQTIVGVNRFADESAAKVPLQRIDQEAVDRQVSRVKAFKAAQDQTRVGAALDAVETAARGDTNLLPIMKDALKCGATIGQVAGRLRAVFGEYRPT